MLSSRQQAYLDAMGIKVWSLRDAPPAALVPKPQPDIQANTQATTQAEEPPAASLESPAAADVPGLKLGPGGGGILLICSIDTDSATRLANDISRTLGSVPVWAWPHADADAVKLVTAVEENLFTTVAIFGTELAMQFFAGDIPGSLHSANLVLLPSMQELQDRADARRLLWTTFCRSGMVHALDHQA
jgi:DNA polymerase III psi subunit